MGNPLRDRRTPSELAESGQVIEIAEKIASFERLAEIVGADLAALDPDKLPPGWREAPVTGRLRFGLGGAQGNIPALDGEVGVTIDAVCQRCLEPMRLELSAELRYLFVATSSTVTDEDGYEWWEFSDEALQPIDVVDEALAMTLPLVAMHVNDASCREHGTTADGSAETTRPFASLKARMEDKN